MQIPEAPPAAAMPNETRIFGLLGGLLILAFFANRLSRRTRVPDLLILMLTGVALGPLSGWLRAGEFALFTRYLGTFALILILFEAGSEIHLREALRHFPVALLFALVAFAGSFAAVALIGRFLLGQSPQNCLLLGGVFGCVSGTIVIPVLQQFGVRGPAALVLVLEAALGDVIAVITVGSLSDIAEGDPLLGGVLRGLAVRTSVAICAAVLAGLLWSRARPRFAAERFGSVQQVGAVLVVYALTRIAGGSGLLAVLAFGLTLANTGRPQDEPPLTFHSDLSFFVRSFFFVLLGASVEFIGREYVLATVAILGGLALARFVSVLAIGRAMRGIGGREKELLMLLLPRGLVNAVLAIQVAGRTSGLDFLPAMAFTIILATNLAVVIAAARMRIPTEADGGEAKVGPV